MEVTPAVSVTPAWIPVNQTGAGLLGARRATSPNHGLSEFQPR